MIDKSIHVLLLDGHTVQAYSVSKALKENGVYVTVFSERRFSYGYASKYPDEKIICPSLKKSPEKFLEFLLEYLRNIKVDLVLPLFDDSADLLNKNRDVVFNTNNTRICLPPQKQYELSRNKNELMRFCRENKIPHPHTVTINRYNYTEAAKKVGFPSLIKPASSSGAVGIYYVNTPEELSDYFSKTNDQDELSLQSFVNHSGYYFSSMIFRSNDGNFSDVVIAKIIRYFPTKGGTSSYNETVYYPEIEKISMDILNKLNWSGFANIDFIIDKQTEEPKLIEINPRIPACIHSAFVSGVNFPLIIVSDVLGNGIPSQKYSPNKATRYLAMDFLWFFFSKKRFKAQPSWFKFFGKNLNYQDGSWRDPFTMFAGIVMGIEKYLNPSLRKSKLSSTKN